MPRRASLHKVIACWVALLMASLGLQPAIAAASKSPSEHEAPTKKSAGVSRQLSVADLDEIRTTARALQGSRDPRYRDEARRVLLWVDILSAKTNLERRAAIRRLPVSIVYERPGDGSRGTVKNYIAGGKTRIQVIVPDAPRPLPQGNNEGPGGPSAGDGRWRLDDSGNCYWDEYDEGPDQCQPPSGGGGGECYYNGQPDTCVTQQELDDLATLVAGAQAEVDQMQAEYDQSWSEYQAYCDQNPWDCEGGAAFVSGPSACAPGCASQAVNAVASITAAAATTYLAGEAIATTAAMTTGAAIATGALVGAAVLVAGWTAWEWYKCMRPKAASPAPLYLLPPFEPVF